MMFPVYHSDEAAPRVRGEVFGRAAAPQIQQTLRLYRRMFAEMHGVDAREAGASVSLPSEARDEIEGIAAGAGVDANELIAVNARTEILAGEGPSECSVIGTGDRLAQNWDWNPDSAAATVIWIVRQGGGWFVTLTEAGMLAKIGLTSTGLGVCVNILHSSADGGTVGMPIHVLLRQVLAECRSVDEAVELLTNARVSASTAVTVATVGKAVTVELSPGGPNVLDARSCAHTNHFLRQPCGGRDVGVAQSVSSVPRLEAIRQMPTLDVLRSHDGFPASICRHLAPEDPWVRHVVTVASVILDLAGRRFLVADGTPCTSQYVPVELPEDSAVSSTR